MRCSDNHNRMHPDHNRNTGTLADHLLDHSPQTVYRLHCIIILVVIIVITLCVIKMFHQLFQRDVWSITYSAYGINFLRLCRSSTVNDRSRMLTVVDGRVGLTYNTCVVRRKCRRTAFRSRDCWQQQGSLCVSWHIFRNLTHTANFAVQGHSRSPILVSIESSYATSY